MEHLIGARVEARRIVDSAPGEVFDFWTDPAQLAQWFVCVDVLPKAVEVDLRVGGTYRIAWDAPSLGGKKAVVGVYRTIDRPRVLAFTWGWEGAGWYESLVRIELAPRDGKTEVTIRHDRLATDEERQGHGQGWQYCLDSLQHALSKAAAAKRA